MYSLSVIVRSKNEEKTIGLVLKLLFDQTVKPLEIIVVDNNSSDKTREIAKKYGCKVITINPSIFTHAYSCNVGAREARGDLIVFTNAHSYPISKTWFADGISHFSDKKVAGVFGMQLSGKKAHGVRKAIDLLFQLAYRKGKKRVYRKISPLDGGGMMSTINAIIRKDLWEEHHFEESLKIGGEDTEWGYYFIRKGYQIIEDPKFSVFHSHSDDFKKVLKRQYKYMQMYFEVYSKYKGF